MLRPVELVCISLVSNLGIVILMTYSRGCLLIVGQLLGDAWWLDFCTIADPASLLVVLIHVVITPPSWFIVAFVAHQNMCLCSWSLRGPQVITSPLWLMLVWRQLPVAFRDGR